MSEQMTTFGEEVSQAARDRAASLVGRVVGERFRIEALVAMGGLAAVFRARHLGSGEVVAIKVMNPEAAALPELSARFAREAVAGKHIFHPNVVAVHELGTLEDGSAFLVQEYVDGKTLRAVIERGPLSALRAMRIARQLAEALVAVHDIGIVHRDVKPLNIMITSDDPEIVKLIDFGLAKVPVEHLRLESDPTAGSVTQAGIIVGTIAYLAPEAAQGTLALDRRSDLYALGLVLYEMLAGRHPFSHPNPALLFRMQRLVTPPAIHVRAPDVRVPKPLEALVFRLLDKNPERRPQHARAVIVALDAVMRELSEGGGAIGAAFARKRMGRTIALAVMATAMMWLVVIELLAHR